MHKKFNLLYKHPWSCDSEQWFISLILLSFLPRMHQQDACQRRSSSNRKWWLRILCPMMNTSVRHLTTFRSRRWQRHQSPTWFNQTLKKASVSVPTASISTSTATTTVPSQSTVGLVLLLVQSDNRESPARVVQLLPPAFTAAAGLY